MYVLYNVHVICGSSVMYMYTVLISSEKAWLTLLFFCLPIIYEKY